MMIAVIHYEGVLINP